MTNCARRFALLACSVVIAFSLCVGCSSAPRDEIKSDSADATSKPIIVLVAASAKDAVEDAAAEFKKEHQADIKISAGPTNALATQITAGGEAHLFLSANEQWADVIQAADLSLSRRDLLTNDLVLVVPAGNPAKIEIPNDLLAKAKKIALAEDKVPAGMYAVKALGSLKLMDQLVDQNKIVRGHDVRSTLAFVERGEVEAGIVYSTDALISKKVTAVFTFDPKTFDKIVYPLVLLKSFEGNANAKEFYEFLATPTAARVFEKHGFMMLPK